MSTVANPAMTAPPSGPPPAAATSVPIVVNNNIRIPAGIVDLASFRRWALSDSFPERARISYLAGLLWIEVAMEQAFSHNDVKAEITLVLRSLAKGGDQGRFFTDGMQTSNPEAGLSTIPDSLFISFASVEAGRCRLIPGRSGGATEVEGTPDMVLEIVSDSSVEKDMERLPDLYRRAGVPEFWRVDARAELRFEILRLTDSGYVEARDSDGWQRSAVFGRSFRLTRRADRLGQPEYTLEVRA
jgi:Uma2 family endonuclease